VAGLAGAGMGRPGDNAAAPAAIDGGAFSPLARAQYAALAVMRWNAFRNGLRTTRGAFEAVASGVNYVFYGMMGLVITVAFGGSAYAMVSKGNMILLPILFWAVFAIWQTVPLMVNAFQQQFDLTGVLRFPIGFAPFYLLHVIFGLVDSATLLGGLGSFGIWAGITIARPALSAWAALALAVFGVFNLLLSRAIFAWLDRWLAKRRTRELVSILFLVGFLSIQFLNPALRRQRHGGHTTPQFRAQTVRNLFRVDEVQRWLPPGVTEMTVEEGARSHPAMAVGSLGLLGLWSLGAAAVLAVRLRALHRGELLSDTPAPAAKGMPARRKASAAPRGLASVGSSGPVSAIMKKDLLTIVRSLPLLYALAAPLVMVVIFASLMREPKHGVAFPLAVPLCIGYAILGFAQLMYNNLGAEGTSIQLLLYAPTPMSTVLLAKNILHALLFCLIAVLAALLAMLRAGVPAWVWLAATGAWLVFALPMHLAIGNVFSLTLPHRMNLGRIGRQRGGHASAVLGTLVQLGILAIGVAVAGACAMFGFAWLATPILLVLAVPAWIAWMRVLRNSDGMALRRRDELLTALAKVE
jgi:ABC-2 type transport system permease protein